MEKKVMNTRLAVAAVALLFGLLLMAGQEAAAADGYAPTTDAAPATTDAAPATATATTDATPATADAAEATLTTTPSGGKASYGKSSKADCEVAGTCDVKLGAAADPTRPGAAANPHTRGCSKITGCRG